MTKKHFVALANMLNDYLDNQGDFGIEETKFDILVAKIANLCEEQNPKFDRKKFYVAVYR